MRIFFGFAVADSMFPGDCLISRRAMEVAEVKAMIEQGVEPCLNPSHVATIDAMRKRFNINVAIPETPPKVELRKGDRLVVMGVRGLPRLTDRHEYTEDEVAKATFSSSLYEIVE